MTVLTLHPHYVLPLDPSTDVPAGVRVQRTHAWMPGRLLRQTAQRARRVLAGAGLPPRPSRPAAGPSSPPTTEPARPAAYRLGNLVERLAATFEFPDRWCGWQRPALAALRDVECDLVLATTPPYTAVLVASAYALRTDTPLVLDYRDPWSDAPRLGVDPGAFQKDLPRHRAMESRCLAQAGLTLAASRTLCRMVEARGARRTLFIPNTTSLSPCREKPAPVHDVSYAGALSYGRSLEPIFLALASLRREAGGAVLRLTYAGDDGALARSQAEAAGQPELLEDVGQLSRRDSRRLLRRSRLAVIITTPRYEYNIPGKLAESLALGCPLLLVAPDDAEMTDLFRRHRLGGAFSPEDVAGIAAYIRSALDGTAPVPVIPETFRSDPCMDRLDEALRGQLGA